MPTEKTQARERLGALVKQARRLAGMRRQDDLAAATGLSVSVISLLERGAKVESKTLRLVEETLRFPPGSFADLIEGRIDTLPAPKSGNSPERETTGRRRSIVDMTRAELYETAERVAEVDGEDAGERWLRNALQMRADLRRNDPRDAHTFEHDRL